MWYLFSADFFSINFYQLFRDQIMSVADVGPGGDDAVVTFEGVAILTPR